MRIKAEGEKKRLDKSAEKAEGEKKRLEKGAEKAEEEKKRLEQSGEKAEEEKKSPDTEMGGATGSGLSEEDRRRGQMETEEGNKVARRRSWADEEEEEEDVQEHKRRMVGLVWIAGAVNQEEEEEAPEAEWEEDEDWLDPVLLEKGIKDEVDFMEKIGLFKEASEKESWEKRERRQYPQDGSL